MANFKIQRNSILPLEFCLSCLKIRNSDIQSLKRFIYNLLNISEIWFYEKNLASMDVLALMYAVLTATKFTICILCHDVVIESESRTAYVEARSKIGLLVWRNFRRNFLLRHCEFLLVSFFFFIYKYIKNLLRQKENFFFKNKFLLSKCNFL